MSPWWMLVGFPGTGRSFYWRAGWFGFYSIAFWSEHHLLRLVIWHGLSHLEHNGAGCWRCLRRGGLEDIIALPAECRMGMSGSE